MSDTYLKSFPSTLSDALAMLYLKNQDLSNLSPEELFAKYQEVHSKIETCRKENKSSGMSVLK